MTRGGSLSVGLCVTERGYLRGRGSVLDGFSVGAGAPTVAGSRELFKNGPAGEVAGSPATS